jgi:nucleotide-binding universal stress UspA family protein
MYGSLILALDGSEGSDRAIPVAEQYARRDGARIVVAHARTHALETTTEDALHAHVEQLSRSGIETSMIIRDSCSVTRRKRSPTSPRTPRPALS